LGSITGVPHQHSFRDLIAANKRKSALLMVAFCLLVPLVAGTLIPLIVTVVGGAWVRAVERAHPALTPIRLCFLIAVLASVFSIVYCWLMYHHGDRVVLRSVQARRIHHDDDPELFNVVEEMAVAAGVPMPRVFLIDDPAANAMATGREPSRASIAVTCGLREILARDELQGVIAHEMSHIRNYDTRVMLMTAVLTGSVEGLCRYLVETLLSLGGPPEDSADPTGCLVRLIGAGVIVTTIWLGPLAVFGLLLAIVLLLMLAPVSAHLIQFAVSRQREYLADASAVELTRYPPELARALWKIEQDRHQLRAVSGATAHLFISNPLKRFRDLGHTAFSSHPPLKERIRRLATAR
jgi:heat shock protein HtpX